MQTKAEMLAMASTAVSFNTHKRNSRNLRNNKVINNEVTHEGEALGQVGVLTYLCSIIDKQGGVGCRREDMGWLTEYVVPRSAKYLGLKIAVSQDYSQSFYHQR